MRESLGRVRPSTNRGKVLPLDEAPPLPVEVAHDLYQQLVAPATPLLAGAAHLLLVPDGALQSLPFGVLLTTAPSGGAHEPTDYRKAPWLAKDYALTVLPATTSLRALRQFA